MSLQRKIVLIFLVLGIGFAFGTHSGLNSVMFPAFDEFERELGKKNLTRVERALKLEAQKMDVYNTEYSSWDQTYEYALGLNDDYIEENQSIAYWEPLDIQTFLYIDRDGQLLWGAIVDPSNSGELSLDKQIQPPITPGHPLLQKSTASNPGIDLLQTRSGPMLVSAHSILPNSGEGESAGTLIIGRYLSSNLIRDIAENAGVNLKLHSLSDAELPRSIRSEIEQASETDDSIKWSHSRDYVSGHKILRDVFGSPIAVLEVNTERSITAIGRTTIDAATLFLLAATAVFLVVTWLFTRDLVVGPIGELTNQMVKMAKTGDFDQQLDLSRRDEIGVMSNEFNRLTKIVSQGKVALEASRDDALALAKAKTEFLGRMSHEIRTPMNGVLGMVELLNRTELDPAQKDYAMTIHESADSLLDIINNILDFSKLESGKLRLEEVTFDLNTFLGDLVPSLANLAHQKGLSLDCICPEENSLTVRGDPYRLRQVLTNLIGNAVKFTEQGGITLRVTAVEDDAEYMNVRFELTDTGIGIDVAQQKMIFESFSQADGSTTRRFGGTGLGLAISKELVDLMGGELALESELGKGSVFSFALCLKASREWDLSATTRAVLSDLRGPQGKVSSFGLLRGRILLAEDNPVNQAVATGMLAAMQVEVVVAQDGNEALQQFLCGSFDAILMDCQMPSLDGYQATQAIRQLESVSGQTPIPIIAVTANAMAGDKAKCLSAGMNDYLSKPFNGKQLYATLSAYLEQIDGITVQEIRNEVSKLSATPHQLDSSDAVDESVLGELCDLGSPELVNIVVESYIESSRELSMKLIAAIDSSDAETVAATAHSLKSSSANVGARKLSELYKNVEMAGRNGDLSNAHTLKGQIEQEYEQVINILRLRKKAAAA